MIQQKPIQTEDTVISVSGKVFYNDRRRRIDVKKPIRDLFENGEATDVGYIMELCLSNDKIQERIKALGDQKITPVLLYFTSEVQYE